MQSKIIYAVFSLFISLIILYSCKKSTEIEIKTPTDLGFYNYDTDKAPAFVKSSFGEVFTPRAQLGRALFYDKSLSINGNTSCGSCHVQALGFGDGKAKSLGFANQPTAMHAMSLVNIGGNGQLFWDGRERNLRTQALLPISNHIEMGLDNEELLIAKIEGSPMYADLFKKAFIQGKINSENIGVALANFVASIVSYNSKFDQVQRNEAVFTTQESLGKELFEQKYQCANCHGGNNFNSPWGGSHFANIGLESTVDLNTPSSGMFKVPSLRNVAVSAPYMHNGSIKTLEDVINHYNTGIKENEALAWELRNFKQNGGMKITIEEKKAMIAFLNTLTDFQMLQDPKWSNPF